MCVNLNLCVSVRVCVCVCDAVSQLLYLSICLLAGRKEKLSA